MQKFINYTNLFIIWILSLIFLGYAIDIDKYICTASFFTAGISLSILFYTINQITK